MHVTLEKEDGATFPGGAPLAPRTKLISNFNMAACRFFFF